MYIQIITHTLDDAIEACDKARAIIHGVRAVDTRLKIRVGISDEYSNLMEVRCPEIAVVGIGRYTGTEIGEQFRIKHAACNAWYENEIVALNGATALDREMKEHFWAAIESIREAEKDVDASELS